MKKASIGFAVLAVALAVCFAPWSGGRNAAVAATPTPAALQYDEIDRMVVPPATPPAPGSWPADYQAVLATVPQPGAAGASPAPGKHGLGSLLSHVMGGNPQDQGGGDYSAAMGNATEMMQMMKAGRLVRYTYYKGWIRTDDPMTQTATIEKCDQHQYITLNLAAKTYAVSNTQPPCASQGGMPPVAAMHRAAGMNQDPGTADMTVKSTSQNLGPLTIDGIGTNGWDRSMEMSSTNATGSCHDSSFKMGVTVYVSQIAVPRPSCPLPHTMGAPIEGMASVMGGCKPTMHVQGGAGGFMDDLNKLVLYRRMMMGDFAIQSDAADMQIHNRMAMVTERGNVAWLSGAPADALFAIPPGFTQAP